MEVFIFLYRILPQITHGDFVDTHLGYLIQDQAVAGLAQPARVQTHFLELVADLLRTQLPGLTTSLEQAINLNRNLLGEDLALTLMAEGERGTDYECFVTIRTIGDLLLSLWFKQCNKLHLKFGRAHDATPQSIRYDRKLGREPARVKLERSHLVQMLGFIGKYAFAETFNLCPKGPMCNCVLGECRGRINMNRV